MQQSKKIKTSTARKQDFLQTDFLAEALRLLTYTSVGLTTLPIRSVPMCLTKKKKKT
jgi:hypothetical protein